MSAAVQESLPPLHIASALSAHKIDLSLQHLRSMSSAQDRLVAPKIRPLAVTTAWIDIVLAQVLVDEPDGRLPLGIKEDVRILDIHHVLKDHRIACRQDVGATQVGYNPVHDASAIRLAAGAVSNLAGNRARTRGYHVRCKIHREADAEKTVVRLREVDPMLLCQLRPVNAEIHHQDRVRSEKAGGPLHGLRSARNDFDQLG